VVAKVCLQLLNHSSNWETCGWSNKTGQTEPLARLADYARSFWPDHLQYVRESTVDTRSTVMLRKFLGSTDGSGPAYRSWYSMFDRAPIKHQIIYSEHLLKDFYLLEPPDSALLPICLFVLCHVLACI